MDTEEDHDVLLQKASGALIQELASLLDIVLWRRPNQTGKRGAHSKIKTRDLKRVIGLIESFQGEPQLLDAQLKTVIPSLVSAFLENVDRTPSQLKPTEQHAFRGICRILYRFCKVRGEKVIVSFFNNEARYLEPILAVYERSSVSWGDFHSEENVQSWRERYIFLLWLSHLMLVPFDLQTISSSDLPASSISEPALTLPPQLPSITLRLLAISLVSLKSPTKERAASAAVLVRLCLRPDMRVIGLLDAMVRWALSRLSPNQHIALEVHEALGLLAFLCGLVTSGSRTEIGDHILEIYALFQAISNADNYLYIHTSAVARKTIIKALRNIVVLSLQGIFPGFDNTDILEDVIETLLNALGDGDSPVRYSASKALSIIALKLDLAMANDIIEAILGSLNEDVLWDGSSRSLTAVNPLRWHGLTLTLSYLLYKRAPSPELLPEVINALVLSLEFEQRSATGSSVGTNVRDAACFGIWALSRRYTTSELGSVKMGSIRATSTGVADSTVPQYLAIQLLTAACLDPAGNIRRGSSAALQELIGRHPNIIAQGIPLVQVVDYHAVGLRERAMVDVASRAASLDGRYWDAIFAGLLGWRGIRAVDTASRAFAAKAIGKLSLSQDFNGIQRMIGDADTAGQLMRRPGSMVDDQRILPLLMHLKPREIEERHGLLLALAAVEESCVERYKRKDFTDPNMGDVTSISDKDLSRSMSYFLVVRELDLSDAAFTSASQRPELTATAICSLIIAFSAAGSEIDWIEFLAEHLGSDMSVYSRLLERCLLRSDPGVLKLIPQTVKGFLSLIDLDNEHSKRVQSWIDELSINQRHIDRVSGHEIALGAAVSTLNSNPDLQRKIIELLASRCSGTVPTTIQVHALQGLTLAIGAIAEKRHEEHDEITAANIAKIVETIHMALIDYKVNERGDVGSLVRWEGLVALDQAWETHLFHDEHSPQILEADCTRLALEKLDKLRLKAKGVLARLSHYEMSTSLDVSTFNYFASWMVRFQSCDSILLQKAILEGYLSSAGMGSESVVQASRGALVDMLGSMPTFSDTGLSLLSVADLLTETFSDHLSNERVLLPLLEVLAFLLDMQILQKLDGTAFKWRTLLSLVQKSHFKSNNMHKLHVALDVYRGLADVVSIRSDVLKKLLGMLVHPFPNIRVAAAETVFVTTGELSLNDVNWSQPARELKQVIPIVQNRVLPAR